MNRIQSSRSLSVNSIMSEVTKQITHPETSINNFRIKIQVEKDHNVIQNYFPSTSSLKKEEETNLNRFRCQAVINQNNQNLQINQTPTFFHPNVKFQAPPQVEKSRESIKIISVQDVEDPEKKELRNKIKDLEKCLKGKETQFSLLKKDEEAKEKDFKLKQENMKKQQDMEIKKIQLQLEEFKKQLSEKNSTIERMKNEMQSRERKLNDLLEASKQEYELDKSRLQTEILQTSQKLNELDVLRTEVLKKENVIVEAQSQIQKLKHNIDQLACKANEQNSNEQMIPLSNKLDWNTVSKTILKTPFSCSQCNCGINIQFNEYLERILKDILERRKIENLESIKRSLLLNYQVKMCSTKNCNFFCIWQSNLQNLSSNQGYCQLCQKHTIFSGHMQKLL